MVYEKTLFTDGRQEMDGQETDDGDLLHGISSGDTVKQR